MHSRLHPAVVSQKIRRGGEYGASSIMFSLQASSRLKSSEFSTKQTSQWLFPEKWFWEEKIYANLCIYKLNRAYYSQKSQIWQ